DIPAPTIYSAFGTKAKILQFVAWSVAAGLDIDRAHEEALAHPDPAQGLRLAAAIQRRQHEVMYDVIVMYQEAARADPDIAADMRTIMGTRERAFARHLEAIAARVTAADGLGVYLALVLPEIYRTLVLERGWSNERYEAWLGESLVHQLLGG